MKNKKFLAAALAVAVLVGFGQTVKAEGTEVPPADRISPTQIEKTLTVPNSIHVTLQDADGKIIDSADAVFQLLDGAGQVVAQWNGTTGYLSVSEGYVLNGSGCTFRAGELYETGSFTDGIRIYQPGSDRRLEPEEPVFVNFGTQEVYVGYGDGTTEGPEVTAPDQEEETQPDGPDCMYARHTLDIVPPSAEGVTVGYLPAGSYTLHQTAAPKGYLPAADRQITVENGTNPENMQKIDLVNQKEEHEHTYSQEWSKDSGSHWHQATCEHGELFRDKAAHSFGPWKVIRQATDRQEGLQERECTVCQFIQQEKIEKLPPETPVPSTEETTLPTEETVPAVEETVLPTEVPSEPTERPTETSEPEDNESDTGDGARPVLWMGAAAVSAAAAAGLMVLRKKKPRKSI